MTLKARLDKLEVSPLPGDELAMLRERLKRARVRAGLPERAPLTDEEDRQTKGMGLSGTLKFFRERTSPTTKHPEREII